MTAIIGENRTRYDAAAARSDRTAPDIAAAPADRVMARDAAAADIQLPSSIAHRLPDDGAADRPPLHLTEAQLTALWRGQRFPEGALVTRQGVPVRVIFQGRAGRGAGPDFRGAVIAGPSGVPLRGDVELHVRSSMFRAHGHHADNAYAGVILHVVFEDDLGEDTPLPGGGSAPVVALAPWVARRAGELQSWLARPLLWREPCHDAVIRMGADGAGKRLDAEGDRRFSAKVSRFRGAIASDGLDQALYEGLLEALGYGGNAGQMLSLARLLPWRRVAGLAAVRDGGSEEIEAVLLGCAGLLPSQRGHRGPVETYVASMERAFAARRLPSLPAGSWKLWGVRPENAPARRIAAVAALLVRQAAPSTLLGVLDASTVNEAIAPIAAVARGYWLTHHDVCAGPCRLPPALIGRSRALEILINVLLPAACATGDAALDATARSLFAKLPRPAVYGATKFIEAALASDGISVRINARRAQGLLELQRNWCTQGGCGRCALS